MIGIHNVVICGKEKGCIIIDGTKIYGIYVTGDPLPQQAEITWINGRGCELYPAGIDMHVHDRWGEHEREDPEHFEAAAIAGGVGTVVSQPNTKPTYELAEQTQERFKGFSQINFLAWIACTKSNLQARRETRRLYKHLVPGGKLMMASTNNPEALVDDEPSQTQILEQDADIGLITVVHAEAEDWIKRNREQYRKMFSCLTRKHHCQIRAAEVEVEGIRRILNIHRSVGGRIHIAHVSTEGGIKLILDAKARGQRVTFESCPHYWTFTEGMVEGENGGFYKMNPALRSPSEQCAVLGHLIKGDVDVSATDHAPHPKHLKEQEGLDECPSGVPGVQNNMLLIYTLKQNGLISSERFVDLTSRNAAKILGLRKGELQSGYDADLILIDPKRSTTFLHETSESKCGWTPYHGMKAKGAITLMMVGGKILKQDFGFSVSR